MTGLLVILCAAILFTVGVALFRPVLARLVQQSAAQAGAVPIPPAWWPTIEHAVPLLSRLSPTERDRLLRSVRDLLDTRHWEGCGGLTLTPEMQIVIAAQASLLELERPGVPFPNLRAILVYPTTFVPRQSADLRAWRRTNEPRAPVPELGEAWTDGTVVVAWDDSLHGGADPNDGKNVVFHEFAHVLDYKCQLTTSLNPSTLFLANPEAAESVPSVSDPKAWRQVLTDTYEQFCAQAEAGAPPVFSRYALTNEAEFFAVATEAFFEQPGAFRAAFPALFTAFRGFYNQDPQRLHDPAEVYHTPVKIRRRPSLP